MDLLLAKVDLRSVVENMVLFILSGGRVKAYFEFPNDLWAVKADEGQISQVVSNLVINAKETMPDGGELCLPAERGREADETVIQEDSVKETRSVSGRVLIMDDESLIQEVTLEMLAVLGYGVATASDGGEAIDINIQRQKRKDARSTW